MQKLDMKRRLLILCITLGCAVLSFSLRAQVTPNSATNPSRLAFADRRGDLALPYPKAAKFKAASQNNRYRFGDLISVDVAILNNSASEVHSLRLDLFADLAVSGIESGRVPIMLYGNPDFIPLPQHYERLKPGEIHFAQILLRVGCENKTVPRFGSGREVFETSSFVSMGRGCIDFPKVGDYAISGLIRNTRVVVDKDKAIKTLTGTFESAPLNITLIE